MAGPARSPAGAVTARPNVSGLGAFALGVRTTTAGNAPEAFTFALPPGKLTAFAAQVESFTVDGTTATLTRPAVVNGRTGSTYTIVSPTVSRTPSTWSRATPAAP